MKAATIVWVLVSLLGGGVRVLAQDKANDVEDAFLYRSVRTEQLPVDAQCGDAKFEVRGQGRYEFTAVRMNAASGELSNEPQGVIGTSLSCFGALSDAAPIPFYSRLTLNGVSAIGRGECRTNYRNFPEPQVVTQECWLKLEQLSGGYIGGLVVANTLATLTQGQTQSSCTGGPCGRGYDSNPPGYLLSGLSVVRLWKPRQ